GLRYRVGPARLYVDLARELAADGFATLRLDPAGMGESDGVLEAGHIHDLWRTIEEGRFVGDAMLAIQHVRERLPDARIFLGGLCGGAVTLTLAAALAPGPIAGLIAINAAAAWSPGQHRPPAPNALEARANLGAYSRKMLSPEAWRRVVTGASDYRAIAATLSSFFGGHAATGPGVNRLYLSAFREVRRRGIPQLFIFSGNDSRWFQFQELVLAPELRGSLAGPSHVIRVIPDANHELHWRAWRRLACDWIRDWMAGAPGVRPPAAWSPGSSARRESREGGRQSRP
ncbi:MAG TPA: alpha/beta fold hydrolase, partial [Vicinamibacterales bacterium]